MNTYDEWHKNLEVDFGINTPWHKFFTAHEHEFDFKKAKILEIGCGRGGFASNFLSKYDEIIESYYAVDYSQEAISKGELFAENKFRNLKFQQGDIQKIDFENEYFDYIFSFETIEHVPRPQKAILELNRVLKNGGTLVLTTPNYFGFFGLYRIYLRLTGRKWTEAGQPINKFVLMPKTIYWLKKGGFKILLKDSEIISYPSPFSNKVIQLKFSKPKALLKWFGLQSFFIAKKKV